MALRQFAINVAALSSARVLQTAGSILAIPVLARLLEPREFGLVALAMPFVQFGLSISDAGIGQSLVRVRPEDRLVWSSGFWLTAMVGAALAAFLLAIAFPVAWLFQQPVLASIIMTLASVPLIQGLLAAPTAELLRKEMFKTLAAVEVLSSLGALAAALILAFAQFGVWALVAQAALYWFIKALIIFPASQFRPAMQFSWAALEGHFEFSRDSAFGALLNFFQRQIDPLVIGKLLGAVPVGLYSMANRLLLLPFQLIAAPVQNPMYVRMVALRSDIRAIRDLIQSSALFLAVAVFPVMAIGAAASEALFRVFLSDKWADAALVFAIIAPAAAVQAVAAIWTPMLLATENTALRLKLTIESVLMWLVILPFAATQGIAVVALAYTVSYFTYSFLRSYPLYLAPVGLTVAEFWGALATPILVSVAVAGLHFTWHAVMHPGALMEAGVAIVEVSVAIGLIIVLCRDRLRANVGRIRDVLARRVGEEGAHSIAH